MSALSVKLARLGACSEAVEWAKAYKSQTKAWDECQRGNWLLWIAGRAPLCSRQELVLAAAACARLALRHTTDLRVLACIEATEGWARGTVSLEDLRVARQDAYAAYAAAYAADAARKEILAKCADLVRAQAIVGAWKIPGRRAK